MFKKILIAAIALCFMSGIALADNYYVGAGAGIAFGEVDVNKNKYDDDLTGFTFDAFVGYNKNLDFGLMKTRGTDSVRLEGLVSYHGFEYDKKKVKGDIDSVAFLPSVYYDAKSLHVYKSITTVIYPYAGFGLGIGHLDVNDSPVSDKSEVSFVWHVGMGIRADVDNDWSTFVGYRYVDMGDIDVRYKHNRHVNVDVTSHDVLAGVAYKF